MELLPDTSKPGTKKTPQGKLPEEHPLRVAHPLAICCLPGPVEACTVRINISVASPEVVLVYCHCPGVHLYAISITRRRVGVPLALRVILG